MARKKAILSIGKLKPLKRGWLFWKKYVKNIINGNTVLNQDFKEFIKSLNDNKVRYLVIGAYALAVHGHPRYTKDLDIWIDRVPENAAKLIQALKQFGFGSLGLKEEDFLTPRQVIQLGYPPNRIDLLNDPEGIDFENCYSNKVEIIIDGISVNFIDLENLKTNKKATGRLQDLADIENLK